MGITGIVVMWIVAAVVFVVVSNDRYGKMFKRREEHWSKYR